MELKEYTRGQKLAKSKKYKMVRMDEEVWETWKKRKDKIQERVKFTTNKDKRITMTNVLRYYGDRKIDIWDEDLINFFYKKNKKRKKFRGQLI